MPVTPDFVSYSPNVRVERAELIPLGVRVHFSDRSQAEFHALTLRENSPESIHPVTREQKRMLTEFPLETKIVRTDVTDDGELEVEFAPDGGHPSRFHSGWLKAWSCPEGPDWQRPPAAELWDSSLDVSSVSFLWGALAENPSIRRQWMETLLRKGVSLITKAPPTEGFLETIAEQVGPIRATNFGRIFDVRVKPDADSNAYTDMALPVHTDLPTRELPPGLQFLFCLESTVSGAESILVDGFRVAAFMRENHPRFYEVLSRPTFLAASRNQDSDYRFHRPVFVHNEAGQLVEVRVNPWLRAPLQGAIEEVDLSYRALYFLMELLQEPRWKIQFPLKQGSCLVINNRRVLHGRTGFENQNGSRWLQGCYCDLDELWSRYRVMNRGTNGDA